MTQESLNKNYQGVFDGRIGYGRKPAVVVIDFINAYTTFGSALYAAPVIDAVKETADLLDIARQNSIPVIFTRVIYSPHGLDGGVFVKKVPGAAKDGRRRALGGHRP